MYIAQHEHTSWRYGTRWIGIYKNIVHIFHVLKVGTRYGGNDGVVDKSYIRISQYVVTNKSYPSPPARNNIITELQCG